LGDFKLLIRINDPGNLGTIIRLCDWFGVKKIICSKDTVDIYNPKVIQASMGSLFRINVLYIDLQQYLQKVSTPIYGAFMDGSNIKDLELPKDIHLILGNESNGISEEVTSFITNRVAVKNIGLKTESLNVAMATAIFLHEFCA
jgi:TrmH family RNA methyltransferase